MSHGHRGPHLCFDVDTSDVDLHRLPRREVYLTYTIFVSHGWHDRWIARQIGDRLRRDSGAAVFLDVFDVKGGDHIEDKVKAGLDTCNELVSLLTPWSVGRNWVWMEIAAAWILRKRVVCVMYGVSLQEIADKHGGLAAMSVTNVITIDDLDQYFVDVAARVMETRDVAS